MAQKTKQLKFERLTEDTKPIDKAYIHDAGFDLYANKRARIVAGSHRLIPTGIKIDLPDEYWGEIKDRSSIASKRTLAVKAGVIDSGYTGEIQILMYNHGPYPLVIEKGEKIAQLVVQKIGKFKAVEVDSIDKETDRGEKGFGSSDS